MSDMGEAPAAPAPSPRSSAAGIRQIVLILLLIAAAGGWFWEFQIARPGPDNAFEKIRETIDERLLKAGSQPLSPADVRKVLGKNPTKVEGTDEDAHNVETYTWYSVIPGRSYNLWVTYRVNANKSKTYVRHDTEPPPAQLRPGFEAPPLPEGSEGEPGDGMAPPDGGDPLGSGGLGAGGDPAGGEPAGGDDRPQRPESEGPTEEEAAEPQPESSENQ